MFGVQCSVFNVCGFADLGFESEVCGSESSAWGLGTRVEFSGVGDEGSVHECWLSLSQFHLRKACKRLPRQRWRSARAHRPAPPSRQGPGPAFMVYGLVVGV